MKILRAKDSEQRTLDGARGIASDPVDASYWPRSIGLRVLIAACYFVLIPTGLLPMPTGWWLLSGGGLLVYSFLMFSAFMRWPDKKWIHSDLGPYLDAAIITLAVVAVANTDYPVWIGYLLVIMSLSLFHDARYLLWYAMFVVGMFWLGIAGAQVLRDGDVSWRISSIASIMYVFTAMNCEVISSSTRRLREMVTLASMTDPLTGLHNRRRFDEALDAAERDGRQRLLAVIMYDIDNFKHFNEEFGHVHADGILTRVAEELRECFRDADSVARYGGDELIVLATVETVAGAIAVAERSLEQVRSRVGVNMSAGVALYPDCAATLEAAVAAADAALGRAKRAGKFRAQPAPPVAADAA